MSERELPYKECLGRIIDCSKHDVNLYSTKSILTAGNVVDAVQWAEDDTWSQDNHTYKKPINVAVNYAASRAGSSVFAERGSEVVQKLRTDASLSARYMAVSAKIGASFAYESTFSEDTQYGFLNDSNDIYIISLSGNQNEIWKYLKPDLQNAMLALPTTVEGNHDKFEKFVALWGTHLVTHATYGTRFEFTVTYSRAKSGKFVDMRACIQAEYGASFTGVSGDVSVKASQDWKDYQSSRDTKTAVIGGNPQHQDALRQSPTDSSLAKSWSSGDRGLGYEALVHMDTTPLGDFLSLSDDPKQSSIGKALNEYISYRVGARVIPRSKDGFGPHVIAWSPPGGVGHVTIRFKSDPQARFTDVPTFPGVVDVLDGGAALKITFNDGGIARGARVFTSFRLGLECGRRTDVEFSGDGWASLAVNQNALGHRNTNSPYNFHQQYMGGSTQTGTFMPGVSQTFADQDLCSKGEAKNLGGNMYRIAPKDSGVE